jgi:hypothetical protein
MLKRRRRRSRRRKRRRWGVVRSKEVKLCELTCKKIFFVTM